MAFAGTIVFLYGCGSNNQTSKTSVDSLNHIDQKQVKVEEDTIAVSPDGENIFLIGKNENGNEISILNQNNGTKIKLLKTRSDENVRSVSWSPGGRNVSFEIYNTEGHSPLTTNHVWAAKNDGSDLREILLPEPDQRFSTYEPVWKSDDSLIVTGISMDGSTKKYFYNFNSGQINILNSKK